MNVCTSIWLIGLLASSHAAWAGRLPPQVAAGNTEAPAPAPAAPVGEDVQPGRVPIPPLKDGQKPNFIVILTDDQGWDDIGLNNPKYVNTPNLDRFINQGTFFTDFYVTPQCAQTRASLMTGRSYPRTGTMLVHGGWDFMNSGEATAGEVMSAAGYRTAQFGKWHNKEVVGYEPWSVGFQQGELPAANSDCPANRNGVYQPSPAATTDPTESMTLGFEISDEDKADKENGEYKMMAQITQFLGDSMPATSEVQQPFFLYHAPHAIHVAPVIVNGTVKKVRFSPPEFKAKYYNNPKYAGIPKNTLDAWAMVEYLDDALGRLISYLKASGLDKTTYVMIMSDNGAFLMPDEPTKKRMPSGMRGTKSEVFEGGVRNFLVVQGPGVQAGVTDSTLVDITDILPTMADLAGIANSSSHPAWDGRSFANLLVPPTGSTPIPASGSANGNRSSRIYGERGVPQHNTAGGVASAKVKPVNRGASLATKEQEERMLFLLGPQCWDADAVPALGPDRMVDRQQVLLNYEQGGMPNHVWKWLPSLRPKKPGFENCIGIRYRDLKWIGVTNTVYRLDESHLETPDREVKGPEAAALATKFSSAAKAWWQSMVAEPHSFNKPTYYLGLGDTVASNVLVAGAHERTQHNVKLLAMGASGFSNPGDKACFKIKVLKAATYDVTVMYTSKMDATVKLSFGTYAAIQSDSAFSITATLPKQERKMLAYSIGNMALPESGNQQTEACLTLVSSETTGAPVFTNLANLRFTKLDGAAQAAAARLSGVDAANQATLAALWQKCNWVKGANGGVEVLQNMFSPYDAEDTEQCEACRPQL